jgi:hypothetical protein
MLLRQEKSQQWAITAVEQPRAAGWALVSGRSRILMALISAVQRTRFAATA